ncbi:MAG: biotin/lipoyl-binding protein [Chloroflexi bacterium]|nr:biotin/lipoyl-binding protein [Chloroflexota bacterium]
MKLSRTVMTILALGATSILALSCAPKQASTATAQNQEITIERGDLSVDITAVGNLALADKQDLAFDIPGTVEEVLVDDGDSVEKGQVLARLDTSEWEKQLTTLTRQVTTAERQVTSAQKQLRDKQTAVTTTQNTVTSKEFSMRQAQLDLQSAQDAVTQIADVKKIQDKIDNAEYAIKSAKSMLAGQFGGGASIDYNYWSQLKVNAEAELVQAKKDMQGLLASASLTVSSDVALDVAKKQLAVEQKQLGITQAQLDLENARLAVEDARNAIAPAQQDLQNAQDDLKTARENLDDAESFGPEIKAPFDGFITKVSVKGGDEVKKGTIAVQVADPTKFEADLLVNETDISKIKLGAIASVDLQAVTGVSLSATVTHIAPTATIQQGVVNYKVTVGIQSLQPIAQAQRQVSADFGGGSANLTQEQINQLRQQRQQAPGGQFGRQGAAFGGANLTQEQIARIAQQRQAAGGAAPTQEQINQLIQQRQLALAGGQTQPGAGQPGGQFQRRATAASDFRLAEGMTVTVNLPVDSRTNVLLAPNAAITTKAGQTSVKVVKADGATEDRVIETGISDFQYTEVISGLSEGEKVMVTRTTATPSTNTNRQTNPVRGGGVIFGR